MTIVDYLRSSVSEYLTATFGKQHPVQWQLTRAAMIHLLVQLCTWLTHEFAYHDLPFRILLERHRQDRYYMLL